jgi:Domain of unknown function (DUF6438)
MLALKFLSLMLVVVLCINCESSKNFNADNRSNNSNSVKTDAPRNQQISEDLLITLERTACYGICAVYKVAVKADGSVTFEGIQNTHTKGKVEDKINENKVKDLIKAFENADYSKFNDKYDYDTCPIAATDSPTVTTSLRMDGKTKTVSHYLGCLEKDQRTPFPPKLTEMENNIDRIIETKRWIGERK